MVHVIREPEINLVAIVAEQTSGHGHIIQYASDSPTSRLPGPHCSPQVTAIYDLTGGFNLRGDRAQSEIQSLLRPSSHESHKTYIRLKETPDQLLGAFSEAGFKPPPVHVPIRTQIARRVADWTGCNRV